MSFKVFLLALVLGPGVVAQNRHDISSGKSSIEIPTVDISEETFRQVVIAEGTKERQGHPSALLMPDGKTMFAIWTIGHGGPADQLKKSVDGGLTWSNLLNVPDNWKLHANCPPLYLLEGPDGKQRITTYVNRGPYGLKMYRAYSEDGGATWSPFKPVFHRAYIPPNLSLRTCHREARPGRDIRLSRRYGEA